MKGYKDITPTEYEIFVREFHEKLLQQDGFEGIDVRHDVKVKGKSGNYNQIDVFWEISVAGVVQKFCVECKKWKNTVKKSDIGSFISTINDIGGARGIYVTTEGYQVGAIKLAEENQIILVEANPVIKKHPARLEIAMTKFVNLKIMFNKDIDGSRRERLDNYTSSFRDGIPDLCDSIGVKVMDEEELKAYLEREETGFYSVDISDCYMRVGKELFQCDTVKYYFVVQNFPELGLDGYSESAELFAKYISDNREIKHYIESYNGVI
ncbi:MAG: restriction endonuclease [Colwellia sp.]|nr:restriction endonuclease [Colwellia sp.]